MKGVSRRFAIISHDVFMVVCAWGLAYLSRYNFSLHPLQVNDFLISLPIVVAVQGLVLWWTGLYKGLWRFASIPDLWNIIRGVLVGTLAISLVLFFYNRLLGVPRSALVFYALFLILFLGAPRLIFRMWKDHSLNLASIAGGQRVLIVGAGRAGEMLARDLHRDADYSVVGFLDDDRSLRGAKVHGCVVLGALDQLVKKVSELAVDMVLIAIPSATNAQMQRVVHLCEKAGVDFRTLPKVKDLMSGRVGVKALREVAIEDLLGRDPVSLDWQRIEKAIRSRMVLVSGAGGSIGSELCRQIARLKAKALVLVENNEYNLYTIERALRNDHPELLIYACLGDVCDEKSVENIFARFTPDIVFHAAAYKHVPMLERQLREAVHKNVIGTRNLALAADRHGCATFVMVSTDKAVNPANIMGSTKRLAEMLCQSLNQQSATCFITVRFGNVLGSAGSVVPLFQEQIRAGGPVTVTHPEMTRYFMTIPEAAQLILQSTAMGKGGEIFVLDMGEPVKIRYLAEQMICLSGEVPDEDIDIVYTGLRPGEKLYEELFYSREQFHATEHEKIMLASSMNSEWNAISSIVNQMEQACQTFDEAALKQLLQNAVPEMAAMDVPLPSNVVTLDRARA